MKTSLAVLLASLVACTSVIPRNEYGLAVISSEALYRRTVAADSSKALVDLGSIRGVRLDIRYATADNFMKRPLYREPRAFLRAPAAAALSQVQSDLAARGLALKVFDAYRPYSVTRMMWEPYKDPDFVADPAKGSRHNRGCAVDVTLVDRDGGELMMPTPYDEFTPRARHDFNELSEEAKKNRALLRGVMERHGFDALESEWWHYDFRGWERFEILDLPMESLRDGRRECVSHLRLPSCRQNRVTNDSDPTLNVSDAS